MKESPKSYRKLAAYTEGEMTSTQKMDVELDLFDSTEDQKRLDRVQQAVSYLREPSAADHIDLLPKLQPHLKTHPLPKTTNSPSRRMSIRAIGLVAAVLIAIAVPLLLLNMLPDAETQGFRAKSVPKTDARSRWIAFNVFRLTDSGEAKPFQKTLHTDDGLLFSYTNLGKSPFSYLMVFSVDDTNQVYWYYPAFLDAKDNPKSIPIAKGASRVGLKEVIAHPYKKGKLTLFALFSDTMVSVSDIESTTAKGAIDASLLEQTFKGIRVKTRKVNIE